MSQDKVTPVFFDWVTSVAPSKKHQSWLHHFLQQERSSGTYKGFHRSHAVEYWPSQIKHFYSPHEIDLPSILVLSGQALGNIRLQHDNDWCSKVVALIARNTDHFSRVDLAIDFMDEGKLARRVALLTTSGILNYGRRKSKVVMGQGIGGGTTTYVGSRTSPLFLRIYDKNAESKGVVPSSRLEFECKSEYAEAISEKLSLSMGWEALPRIFTGLLHTIEGLDRLPEIESLRYGDVTVLDIPRTERLSDKKEWLSRQIAPSFLKDVDGQGGELWDWFQTLIREGRERE